MPKRVKVILLGFGNMGKVHFHAYRRMKNVEVVGIYSASRREEMDGVPVTADLDECLSWQADAADICLPTFLHKQAFAKALAYGKHIFLEKPVAHTFQDAREMLALAKQGGKKIMVGQVLRYFPEYVKLRENIDRSKPASAQLSRRAKLPEGTDHWFMDRGKSGGVILDLALHDIDYLRWTLGPVTRIYAQTDPEHYYALITMRHLNGSISRVEASWRDHGGFAMEAEIAQEGTLLTYQNRLASALHLYKPPHAVKEAVEIPAVMLHEDPYYRELAAFVGAIQDDKEVAITMGDAYESTKLALLAVQSADEKRPVPVHEE